MSEVELRVLERSEEQARESAGNAEDISVRIAHLKRAELYGEQIAAVKARMLL